MTRLSFTQTTQNALRELDRLEGIRGNLASLILDLLDTHPTSPFISIYTDRLKENVIPAINEVKAYLISQEALVIQASN